MERPISRCFTIICTLSLIVIFSCIKLENSRTFQNSIKASSLRNFEFFIGKLRSTETIENKFTTNKNQLPYYYAKDLLRGSFRTNNYPLVRNVRKLFTPKSRFSFSEEKKLESFEEVHKHRLKTLISFCRSQEYRNRRYAFKKHIKNGLQITLIPKFKAFECRVPKTGSSSRGAILWKLFHEGEPYMKHQVLDDNVPKINVATFARNHKQHSKFENWFGFQFARDPFERALSGYFNKIIGKNWFGGAANLSLNKFLNRLSNFDPKLSNNHFLPQISHCDPCLLNMSFIGRTETLKLDMDYLINNATKMYEKIQFHYNSADIKEKLLNQKKTNYSFPENMTVDVNTLFKFFWAYRLDYLAFGYNPLDTITKTWDMFGAI